MSSTLPSVAVACAIEDRRRASALAWVTIVHLASSAALLGLVAGPWRALATEQVDLIVSMASQVAFLAGGLFAGRRAAARAHLAASLLLALAGWSLLALGVSELASAERPVLGDLVVFGHAVWRGWPAIGALLWSALPALLLRRAKLRLATELRDEGARAGVETNRVDFVTALAAIAGVGGVGAGWWWADAVAAVAISIDVLCGGAKRLRRAIGELVETPAALRVAA